MGNGVMCATTQKSGVAQGDANTPKNSCATTTTPKGGWGVVALRHLSDRGVVQNKVANATVRFMAGTLRRPSTSNFAHHGVCRLC